MEVKLLTFLATTLICGSYRNMVFRSTLSAESLPNLVDKNKLSTKVWWPYYGIQYLPISDDQYVRSKNHAKTGDKGIKSISRVSSRMDGNPKSGQPLNVVFSNACLDKRSDCNAFYIPTYGCNNTRVKENCPQSCNNCIDDCCNKLTLSSDSVPLEHSSYVEGTYVKDGISNGRIVYKNDQSNDAYLHFSPNYKWMVSKRSDIGTDAGNLYSLNCTGTCPKSCKNWKYAPPGATWTNDTKVTIECDEWNCNYENVRYGPRDDYSDCTSSLKDCKKCVGNALVPYNFLSWLNNAHCSGLTREPTQRFPKSSGAVICSLDNPYDDYYKAPASNNCPQDGVITTEDECKIAASKFYLMNSNYDYTKTNYPSGCFYSKTYAMFNGYTNVSDIDVDGC